MHYYEHHIGDYDEATAHLTAVEDGIYSRLIRKYYATEKPLIADMTKLARLVRARSKEEKQAVEDMLAEFFTLEEDGWHQAKCDEVIAAFHAGEPEREAKKANEETRLKRHRDERAALFKTLTDAGQHAAWNIGMKELRELVAALPMPALQVAPETAAPATPATAPATPATATHEPTPTTQPPELNTSAPIGAASADAPAEAPAAPPEQAPAPAPAPAPTAARAGTLPTFDLLPDDLDRYGMPGHQTVEQLERELWDAGKALLMLANVPKSQAGSFIGGLIAKWKDRQMVIEVVRAAIVERPSDPKGWMTAACETRATGARRNSVSNLTERRVSTMAGLKNTGAQNGNSTRPRDSSVIDAEVRVVNGN